MRGDDAVSLQTTISFVNRQKAGPWHDVTCVLSCYIICAKEELIYRLYFELNHYIVDLTAAAIHCFSFYLEDVV